MVYAVVVVAAVERELRSLSSSEEVVQDGAHVVAVAAF